MPVVFRRRVQHDLDAAFNWYYEEQQAGLGEEFLSAVHAAIHWRLAVREDCGVIHNQPRSRAGLTQKAVAGRMGTTKSAVSRLEAAGTHAPSVASLNRNKS